MKFCLMLVFLTIGLALNANESMQTWRLGEIKQHPGKQIVGLNPFPEYIRFETNQDASVTLVIKMRNQKQEKVYSLKRDEENVIESHQVYDNQLNGFDATELAKIKVEGQRINAVFVWTSPSIPTGRTSGEFDITFLEEGRIHFLRYNGKNSSATYLEFEAYYEQE